MGTRAPNNDTHARFNSVEEKIARRKEIDVWLPMILPRNAEWYHPFHNVTAMFGAGVLCLPYAMFEIGWGPGVTVLVVSWIITLNTLWQMVGMHVMPLARCLDIYPELGQHAFGGKLGLYIVVPQQLVVEIGVNLVYMVTGGLSLKKIYDTVCSDCHMIKLTYFIMIFTSACFVRSLILNFNSRSKERDLVSIPSLIAKKKSKW